MGKLKNILLGTFLFAASAPTFAGWRIVIDRNCIATVGANLASQKLIEGQHNQRLDSIASKKQKVELYTVSMATIKELYKLSMENISGFGTESLYYKEIGSCAFDILKDVPELIETVGRAKFTNKLLCLNELGNLVAETQQLQRQGAEPAQRGSHGGEEKRRVQPARPLRAADPGQSHIY